VNINATLDIDLERNWQAAAAVNARNLSTGSRSRGSGPAEIELLDGDCRDETALSVPVQGGVPVQVHVEVNVNVLRT
jgi:hypothetical protein